MILILLMIKACEFKSYNNKYTKELKYKLRKLKHKNFNKEIISKLDKLKRANEIKRKQLCYDTVHKLKVIDLENNKFKSDV